MRANAALKDRVAHMRRKLAMLAHNEIDPRLLELLFDVQEEAVLAIASAPKLTAVEESEREDDLSDWLDAHGVAGAWELAPVFVGAGTTPEFLDKLAESATPDVLDSAVHWLAYTLETELLLERDHRLGHPHLEPVGRRQAVLRTWTARRSSAPTSMTGSRAPWP